MSAALIPCAVFPFAVSVTPSSVPFDAGGLEFKDAGGLDDLAVAATFGLTCLMSVDRPGVSVEGDDIHPPMMRVWEQLRHPSSHSAASVSALGVKWRAMLTEERATEVSGSFFGGKMCWIIKMSVCA